MSGENVPMVAKPPRGRGPRTKKQVRKLAERRAVEQRDDRWAA